MRRNKKALRAPHPDARIEAELQRILMLRRLSDGYEAQIRQYTAVTDDAQQTIGRAIRDHGDPYVPICAGQLMQVLEASEQRIARAEERIAGLRGEIHCVHEEIGDFMAKLSDTDLAFLEPPTGTRRHSRLKCLTR